MEQTRVGRRFRDFLRHHTHVTLPDMSERRAQINTTEVIKKLDAIGMQHIPLPTIWDGVHLIDEGSFASQNEIERRTRLTYRMRLWKPLRLVDDFLAWSQRDVALYHQLATCLRDVKFELIRGRTDIDRAIANVAVIATAKRAIAVGIPMDKITQQINWALSEVESLETDEVELLECLPDERFLKPTEKIDFEQMSRDRG